LHAPIRLWYFAIRYDVFIANRKIATQNKEGRFMNNDSDAIKELLLRENEEFQRLAKKHHDLEGRLLALSSRSFLSEEEKIEEVTLKKQKLVLKDKMADLIRKHQALSGYSSPTGATPPSP
jgi:uncharacterized protein YdcH (DUF465 family)